jgi:acylphosphatase
MKLKATITGKVHNVGYRVALTNIALQFGIERFNVFNTHIEGRQTVICLIDASDEIIEAIKQRINTEKPEKAIIESIKFEEYTYEIPPIERCMQAFQMEHWGRAIPILLSITEKQDKTIEIIKDESQKTREELGGIIKDESQKTREELGTIIKDESQKTREELGTIIKDESQKTREEIVALRGDIKSYMEERFAKIEKEIATIKSAIGL